MCFGFPLRIHLARHLTSCSVHLRHERLKYLISHHLFVSSIASRALRYAIASVPVAWYTSTMSILLAAGSAGLAADRGRSYKDCVILRLPRGIWCMYVASHVAELCWCKAGPRKEVSCVARCVCSYRSFFAGSCVNVGWTLFGYRYSVRKSAISYIVRHELRR